MHTYDAVVLAGGDARRLGGVDKPGLVVAGLPLLQHALQAVRGAGRVVVVGPTRDHLSRPAGTAVLSVQESPAGGGPVAALAAGLPLTAADLVAVLASDMPLLDSTNIDALAAAAGSNDGALLVDPEGRRQYLAAVYRRSALDAALASLDQPAGASMRMLVSGLTLAEVVADPDSTLDCDTWDSVERSRQLLEER